MSREDHANCRKCRQDKIGDPRVAESVETCSACPEQYEGKLVDGRLFYFRYRFGRASLAVGHDDSINGEQHVIHHVGAPMDGCFDDNAQRDLVFSSLLDEFDDPTVPHGIVRKIVEGNWLNHWKGGEDMRPIG